MNDKVVQVETDLNKKIGLVIIAESDYSEIGYIKYSDGGNAIAEGYRRTIKKWVAGGSIVTVTAKGTSTVAILAVFDVNNNYIQSESVFGDGNILKSKTVTIQGEGRYIASATELIEVPNSGVEIISVFVENSELTTILEDYATNYEAIKDSDLTLGVGSNIADMTAIASKDATTNGVFNGWLDNSYVPQNILDGAAGQWRTYKLFCSNYQGQNLTFGITNSSIRRWAFYNGATKLNYGDYAISTPQKLAVPQDATILYVMLRRYEATESYANWRINIGDALLPYEPYTQLIEQIKGKGIKPNNTAIENQIAEIGSEIDTINSSLF